MAYHPIISNEAVSRGPDIRIRWCDTPKVWYVSWRREIAYPKNNRHLKVNNKRCFINSSTWLPSFIWCDRFSRWRVPKSCSTFSMTNKGQTNVPRNRHLKPFRPWRNWLETINPSCWKVEYMQIKRRNYIVVHMQSLSTSVSSPIRKSLPPRGSNLQIRDLMIWRWESKIVGIKNRNWVLTPNQNIE
jgi:hypothetical protein